MRRLLALLSVPPPGLRPFIVMPAALVFGFTFLSAFETRLADAGLSPFVLAVVLAMGVNWAWQFQGRDSWQRLEPALRQVVAGLVLAILAVLLFVHEPLWCQRVFTIVGGMKALFLAHALWRCPEDFALLGGPREGPEWFAQSWARWKLVSILMIVLMNEAAIRYGTQADWIVVWSVAPLTAYCLMHWTIVATWDDEETGE